MMLMGPDCHRHTVSAQEYTRNHLGMPKKQRMKAIAASLLGLLAVTIGLAGSLAGEIWLLGGAIGLGAASWRLLDLAQRDTQ